MRNREYGSKSLEIDILRAELVARLQKSGGRSVLDQVDVDRLTDILTGKASPRT